MENSMKIFLIAAAVFCSYLIVSLPFASAVQINLIFNQATVESIIVDPQGLVNKELTIEHDTLWSKINAHLEIRVSQPQYEIKRAYVYFCGGMDPIDCITKDPVTFETYVNVSQNWNDIFSGQQYRYPQTSNILSIVRVDIGGKITWTGFWDQIERTSTQEFKIRSFDTSSIDVYLKSLEDQELAASFIQNYKMIPTQWIETTSFGLIGQTDTQVLYGIGADQTEMPQFRSWKTTGKTVGETGKEYELVFPGTSSLIANPVVINSNPPYVCGNSVCESDAGESQANCCLDCTDPQTRACTGDLDGKACYIDSDHPEGYCGTKCGQNGCELGENAGSCCLDCGCQSGFLCDVSQWKPSGACINSSAINLVLDSAKTQYTSCEIPHDVALSVHIMNPPSDLQVQQWYYSLRENETGTQISADRVGTIEAPDTAAPHMYNLKLHIDPLENCMKGSHTIPDNALHALITYARGSEYLELSTDLPDINIAQETISMKEIQSNMKERMQAVMDFIEQGIGLVKMMLMLCIVTILAMLVMSVLAGLSYAFGGEPSFPGGVTKQAGPDLETPTSIMLGGYEISEIPDYTLPKDEIIETDKFVFHDVGTESELSTFLSNQKDGQTFYVENIGIVQKSTNPITNKPTLFGTNTDGLKTKVEMSAVVEEGSLGVQKSGWLGRLTAPVKNFIGTGPIGRFARGFARFFKDYGQGLKFGFDVAKTVCEVTSMLIGIFTSITTVWTKYIAFQTCMEVYENHMGKGICDQNPESCVNEMLGCLNSLDGIRQDAENMIPQIGTSTYGGGSGTVSAYLNMYEVGRTGAIKETCGSRQIYFRLGYGIYSKITAEYIPANIDTRTECTRTMLSETEFKNMLPLGTDNPKPANQVFNCGTGRYKYYLFGDGKNLEGFTINFNEECPDPASLIDKDSQQDVQGLVSDANKKANDVKSELEKTKDKYSIQIGHLDNAIDAMDDAYASCGDGQKQKTIEEINTARDQIAKAKSSLTAPQQDKLEDADKQLNKALKELE